MRILWLSLFLLFSLSSMSLAQANTPPPDPTGASQAASGELWNAIRARQGSDLGTVRSQVKGIDSDSFMSTGGAEWLTFRMEQLIPIAAYVLGFSLLGILLFRLIRGKIKIKSGRTTKRIKRFSTFQRWVHWITAILFVALGITGVSNPVYEKGS